MFKYVVDALNSKDNIKDQLKLLREYRYRKGVRKYVDNLIFKNQYYYEEHNNLESKYILYCIVKYYYGLDAKEVKPPKGKEPILLVESYHNVHYEYKPITNQPIDKLRKGDRFIIISGAFKNYEALIDDIDIEKEQISVVLQLFGQDTKIELDYQQLEEVKRERKSRNARKNKI